MDQQKLVSNIRSILQNKSLAEVLEILANVIIQEAASYNEMPPHSNLVEWVAQDKKQNGITLVNSSLSLGLSILVGLNKEIVQCSEQD